MVEFANTIADIVLRMDGDLKDIRQALDRIDARLDMIESRAEVRDDVAELVRRDSLDDGITGVNDGL